MSGARSVLGGSLSLGQLIVFISYLAQLYTPVNQITQSWGLIAGARIGARRCFEVLDTEADLKDGTRGFPPEGASGAIAWRHVGFRYRAEMPVLNEIDLDVAPGTKVALVGATGAGKSTLLGLLPRFFDPSGGHGPDRRRRCCASTASNRCASRSRWCCSRRSSFRCRCATTSPMAGPARATRRSKKRRGSPASIRSSSLPQGYDTMLGDGATLSEGEKQRLTIARAILRDAPILILDEPTSALDVETEALVMEGIERLTQGRTTFIIAHRLSTVRSADLILVLRDGGIAEQGGFAELLRRGGDLRRSLQHAVPRQPP